MPGADLHVGKKVAERIRTLFAQVAWNNTECPRPTLSIGVAELGPREPAEAAELLRRADVAMYAAKRSGRGRTAAHGELQDAA